MRARHEGRLADLALRAGGIVMIGIGGAVAIRLHHMALDTLARDMASLAMLLAAIVFVCGSTGSALVFAGSGLWETVEVAERWRRLKPSDGQASSEVERDS